MDMSSYFECILILMFLRHLPGMLLAGLMEAARVGFDEIIFKKK